jgi:toxin ParE1/3/4
MRVRFSPEAFADRERIFEYLHARSPDGARNVLASIRAAVAQLADNRTAVTKRTIQRFG